MSQRKLGIYGNALLLKTFILQGYHIV